MSPTYDYCRGIVDGIQSPDFPTKDGVISWIQQIMIDRLFQQSEIDLINNTMQNEDNGSINTDFGHYVSWTCKSGSQPDVGKDNIIPSGDITNTVDDTGGTLIGDAQKRTDVPSPEIDTTEDTSKEPETELKDPTLELAKQWYIELDCPDMNVDCCEGIDSAQEDIKKIYKFLQDEVRDRLVKIEQEIATLQSNIYNTYEEIITQIEYYVKNIYDSLTFEIETKIQIFEDHISQICGNKETSHETIFQTEKEKTPKECTNVIEFHEHIESDCCDKSNNGKVEDKLSKVSPECCEFPQPWIIKFDPDQLKQILDAINSIGVNISGDKTPIQTSGSSTCEEEFPSEMSYELSECLDGDIAKYRERKDIDKLIKEQSTKVFDRLVRYED